MLLDRDISENKPDINNPISIDTEFIRFNNHVMNILNKYAPLKKKIVKGKLNPWMTSDIVHLMKQRNKAHRRALSTKSPEDWKMYRVARNECNRKLNQGKKSYFQDKFQKATESSLENKKRKL
jgi:ribosomal protein L29